MISQFFPSKKPKIFAPVYTPPPRVNGSYSGNLTEAQHAAKRGLSIEEYRSRVQSVAKAQASLGLYVTDQGFPSQPADLEEHGKCIVVGICRHYNDYGTVQWHEPPFILSVSPLKDRSKIIHCTPAWLVKSPVALSYSANSEVC